MKFFSIAKSIRAVVFGSAFFAAAIPQTTDAHGFAGARFFPATLTTDDPFVADELSLPTVSTIITPENTRDTEVSFDISKRITDNWDIELGANYIKLEAPFSQTAHGFDNLELGTKYVFLKNDAHEAILSLGCNVELGGTGSRAIGADRFTTFTPGLFFGKGLGDLPKSLSLLRPLALTGQIGVTIPTSASSRTFSRDPDTGDLEQDIERHPNTLQYGFAIEYSLIYLQEQVKDVGLKAPFDRMIPLVEFAFESPFDRGVHGQTTGTVNPGVIWSGKYCQIGAEAVIPYNSRTGSNVGVIVQLHYYLDDLLPQIFGKPLFGSRP